MFKAIQSFNIQVQAIKRQISTNIKWTVAPVKSRNINKYANAYANKANVLFDQKLGEILRLKEELDRMSKVKCKLVSLTITGKHYRECWGRHSTSLVMVFQPFGTFSTSGDLERYTASLRHTVTLFTVKTFLPVTIWQTPGQFSSSGHQATGLRVT